MHNTPVTLEWYLIVDRLRSFESKDAEELYTRVICEGDDQELEKSYRR